MAKTLKRSQKTKADDRDTFHYVMRFTPTDKAVITTISPYDRRRRGKKRIDWFEELVPYVRKLKFGKPKEPKRHPMRLEMPKALVVELQDKADKTGKSMVELLILAARAYAKENDITLDDDDAQSS